MAKEKSSKITFTEGSVFQAIAGLPCLSWAPWSLQAAYGAVDLLVVGQFGDASSISAVRNRKRVYADGNFHYNQPGCGVFNGRHRAAYR